MAFKKQQSAAPAPRARTSRSATSGPVFSYYANRSVRAGSTARSTEEPTSTKRPTYFLRRWSRRLPSLGAILVILVISILCLQLNASPKVVTVGPSEGQVFLRDRNVYTAAAKAAFNPLFNRNKLTVNANKISADLERQFPELKVVSVTLPFIGTQPTVYIQPATPKLLLTNQTGSYLLDSDGRALISGSQVPSLNSLHVPVITDQSNLQVQIGQIALPSSAVSFISQVVGQLNAKGLSISQLVLPQETTELQVHLNGLGYYIRFNLHGDAREEAGTYLAVKQYLDTNHKTPGSYVDVRVENKAYYK
jgi:hypothetical protein